MFQEKFRKAVSILLIVCMTIGSNGFTTLAQGDAGVFDDAHKGGSQNNPTNYYYQYQEELNSNGKIGDGNNSINDDGENGEEEKENIVLDGEDTSNNQKIDAKDNDSSNDDASDKDNENQNDYNEDEGDEENISPDNFGDGSDKSNNDYADEPEEDATDKTTSNTDSIEPSSEEPQEDTSDEESTKAEETTTAEQTTTEEQTTEEQTTAEQSETTESSTLETTTIIEQTQATTETTTINNIDTTTKATDSEIIKDIVPEEATESETTKQNIETNATDSEAEEINTNATDSEIEKININATESDADKTLSDLISTESEMKLSKSTYSNVIIKTITRYIKSTKSEIATKSQWKVKTLLNDTTQESGAIVLSSTQKEDLEKYMADTVKVLLVDQYGNEKVVRVKADWEFDIVDLEIEQSVKQYNEQLEERNKEENSINNAISIGNVNIDNATDDKKLDGATKTIEIDNNEGYISDSTSRDTTTKKEVVMEYVGEIVDTNVDDTKVNNNQETNDKKTNDKETIVSSSKSNIDAEVKTELISVNENNDNDMVVSKVVYEYVDVVVEGDVELANENDLKPEKMIVGNADNKINTKNMPHAIYPRLNKAKLLENISKVIALEEKKEANTTKEPEYLSTEVTDEKTVSEDEYNNIEENHIEENNTEEGEQNNNLAEEEKNVTLADDENDKSQDNNEEEKDETVAGFTNTNLEDIDSSEENDNQTDGIDSNTNNTTTADSQNTTEVTIDFDEDFDPVIPPIFGATSHSGSHPICAYPSHTSCSGHFKDGSSSARLTSHTTTSAWTSWASVLTSMGAKSGGTQYYALNSTSMVINTKVTITGNCYICLNGNKLTFGNSGYMELAAPATSDSQYNFYICDCKGGATITSAMASYWPNNTNYEGWGSKTINGVSVKKSGIYRVAESHIQQDPYTYNWSTVSANGTCACIRGVNGANRSFGFFGFKLDKILSMIPNENGGEWEGYEVESAAFLYVGVASTGLNGSITNRIGKSWSRSNLYMEGLTVSNLIGTQGGFACVNNVIDFCMENCTFKGNMAYKGACVNVKYEGYSSDRYCYVAKNTIGGDSTLVSNTKQVMKYGDGTSISGQTEKTILLNYQRTYANGNSFAHIYNNENIDIYTDDTTKRAHGDKDNYYQRTFALQNIIEPFGAWQANAMILMTNYNVANSCVGSESNDKQYRYIYNNNAQYNNTFDNCGIIHFQQRASHFDISNPYKDSSYDFIDNAYITAAYNTFKNNKDIAKGTLDAKSGNALTISIAPFNGIDTKTYVNGILCDGEYYDIQYFKPSDTAAENELTPTVRAITDKYSYTLDYFYEGGTANHHSTSGGVNGVQRAGALSGWSTIGLTGNRTDPTPNAIAGYKFFVITGYNESVKRQAGIVKLNNNIVENNRTRSNSTAGGISVKNAKELKVSSDSYKNNETEGNGGGLLIYRNNKAAIDGTTFENNYALITGGGLAALGINEEIKINDSNIFKNNVAYAYGGAIGLEDALKADIGKINFERNAVASGYTNSVILSEDQVNAIKVLSERNIAYLKYRTLNTYSQNNNFIGCGGAVSFRAVDLELRNKSEGGVVISKNAELTFKGSNFVENEASYLGGAIFAETIGSKVKILGDSNNWSRFESNMAGKSGGAISLDNTNCTIDSVKLITNLAEQGGAIFTTTHDADNTDYELVLKKNGTGEDDPLPDYDDTTCYITNCLIDGNSYLKDTTTARRFQYPNDKNQNNDNPLYKDGKYTENASNITSDGGILRDANGKPKYYTYKMKKTADEYFMNAGGAIFTFQSKVVFDKGTYVTNNYNTIYTVGGRIWTLRQTANHDYLSQAGLTESEDITFIDNKGQYVFGHGLNFGAEFYLLGGQIINNNLEIVTKTTKTYKWYDYSGQGPKYVDDAGHAIPNTQTYQAWLEQFKPIDNYRGIQFINIDYTDEGVTDSFQFNPYWFNYDPDGYIRSTNINYASNTISVWYHYINYNLKSGYSVTSVQYPTQDTSVRRHYPSNVASGAYDINSPRSVKDDTSKTGDAAYGQDTLVERIKHTMQIRLDSQYDLSLTELNLSFEPEKRIIYCGGNLVVKGNTRPDTTIEQNLPLEESSGDRIYRFGLLKKYKLATTSEISLTPQEPKKTSYQLFGQGYEGATVNNNKGLWTEDWIEGCDYDGAVPANMFINARQDDPADSRVIYIRDAENEHKEIMLEDPNQLLRFRFNMLADDATGQTKLTKQFKDQYIENNTKVKNPISNNPTSIQDLVYSKDSSMRLLDFMGFQDQRNITENAERFKKFDFSKAIDKTTMIEETDKYNQYEIYGVYSRLDRPHKLCGIPIGVACNHADGSVHDEYYGYYNATTLTERKEQERLDVDHKVVEVSTAAQLLYAYYHPEYLYELQNDIVLTDTIWNRPIDQILNNDNHPLTNFKLCLNGHSIVIDSSMAFLALAGNKCHIMNCQNKDVYIHYTATHFSQTNTINFPDNYVDNSGVTHNDSAVEMYVYGYQRSATTLNENGLDTKGSIIFDTMYTSSTKQSFMNLGTNNKLIMDNIRYQNIGSTQSNANKRILSSVLTIPCDSFMTRMSFTNIVHQLTRSLSSDAAGNGIVRFTDDKASTTPKKHVVKNCYFGRNTLTKNGTAVVSSHLAVDGSSLEMEDVFFYKNTIGGTGALLFSPTSDTAHAGDISLKRVQFLYNNKLYDEGITEYKAGAISGRGVLGDINIEDSIFKQNGYETLGNHRNLYGGAIFLEGTGVNVEQNDINFTNTIFESNVGYLGGAIYMSNTSNVNFASVSFIENYAMSGSAVYNTETSGRYSIGNKLFKNVKFLRNGVEGVTKYGTVWTSNVTNATNRTIFEDIEAKENVGNISFLYTDTLAGSHIVFKGTNYVTENLGPVITVYPQSSSGSHNAIIFFDGENYFINNNTRESYAIAALGNINTRFAFNNIIQIKDNKNADNKDANLLINKYVNKDNSTQASRYNNQPFLIAKYDDDIGPEDGRTVYGSGSILATRSYISFSVTKDELINRNIDILLFKWNSDTIQDFGTEHLMSNEHILIDEAFAEEGYAVYKTRSTISDAPYIYGYGEDFLAIGNNSGNAIARKIMGYSSKEKKTDEYTLVKYGATAYIDNFGNPDRDTGYESYTYEGWLGETEDGYTVWDFTKDRMLSSKDQTVDQALDAMWSTNHGHKVCGTADGTLCSTNDHCGLNHANGGDDWIVAYSDRFLNIFDDRKYVLQNDITMTEAIKNPKPGYAVCLNGYSITRAEKASLVSMMNEAGGGSMYLTNCHDSQGYVECGIYNGDTFDIANDTLIISSGSNTALNTLGIYNVNFHNVGATDVMTNGSFIDAECTEVELSNIVFNNNGYLTSPNSFIYINDGRVKNFRDIDFSNLRSTNMGENGLIHISNIYGSNNTTPGDGTVDIQGLYINNIESSKTKACLDLENIDTVNIKESAFSNISMSGANFGAGIYVKSVTNLNIGDENATDIDVSFASNKASYGAGIYVDYDPDTITNGRKVNVYNARFESNDAERVGGAIYTSYDGDSISSTINKTEFKFAKKIEFISNKAADGAGGAIYMANATAKQKGYNRLIFGDDTAEDSLLMQGNTAKTSGGAIYITDGEFKMNYISTNSSTIKLNVAEDYYGGFLYQERVDSQVVGSIFSNKSRQDGNAVYVKGMEEGDYRDSIKFGSSTGTGGFTAYNNINTAYNHSHIYIGRFTNFSMHNDVVMRPTDLSVADTTTQRTNIKVLYCNDDGSHKLSDIGVTREVGANYNYANSYIHATVDYKDETLLTKYLQNAAYPFKYHFFPDMSQMYVYFSGVKSDMNLHVGASSKFVNFELDGGKWVDEHGVESTTIDSQVIALGSATVLPDNLPAPERMLKTGYRFAGWVSAVYQEATDTTKWQKFDPYGADPDKLYALSEDQYLKVYAVWQQDTDKSAHTPHNMGHSNVAVPNWIEINYYEQLFFDGDLTKGYYLNSDVNDRLSYAVNQIDQTIKINKLCFNRHKIVKSLSVVGVIDDSDDNNVYMISGGRHGDDSVSGGYVERDMTLEDPTFTRTLFSAGQLDFTDGFKVDNFKAINLNALIVARVSLLADKFEFTHNSNQNIVAGNKGSKITNSRFANNSDETTSRVYVDYENYMIRFRSETGAEEPVIIEDTSFISNSYRGLIYAGSRTGGDMFDLTRSTISYTILAPDPLAQSSIVYIKNENPDTAGVTNEATATFKNVSLTNNNNQHTYGIYSENTIINFDGGSFINCRLLEALIYAETTRGGTVGPDVLSKIYLKDMEAHENDITRGALFYTKEFRDSDPQVMTDIYNSNISNNLLQKGAILQVNNADVGVVPRINFAGGKVVVSKNAYNGVQKNIYLPPHNDPTKVTFNTPVGLDKLTADSEISIFFDKSSYSSQKNCIACDTWTEEARQGGATEQIFKIPTDLRDYIVFQQANNIKLDKTVTVIFDTLGIVCSPSIPDQNVASGSVATAVGDPHPDPAVVEEIPDFLGWYTDLTFTKLYNFDSATSDTFVTPDAEGNYYIYALWDAQVTVDIAGNGYGRGRDGKTDFHETLPATISYIAQMGKPLVWDPETNPAGQHRDQDHFNRPDDPNLIEAGWWTKNGWNNGKNDGDWGTEWKFDTTVTSVDTVLYARWKGATISVTFEDNEASGSTAVRWLTGKKDMGFEYNSTLYTGSLPKIARDGYTFVGWYDDPACSDGHQIREGANIGFCYADDFTAYAKWTPNITRVKFSATISSAVPTMPIQVLTYDKRATINTCTIKRTGYAIKQWILYEDNDPTKAVLNTFKENEQVVNITTKSEITLFVDWISQSYTLSFDLNDTMGSTKATISVASKSVTHAKPIGELPIPTRDGYEFGGWYKKSSVRDTDVVTADTLFDWTVRSKVVYDTTIYAKWVANLYTVSFDKNGSDVVGTLSDIDAVFDKALTIPKNVYKRKGYEYLYLVDKDEVAGIDASYSNTTKLKVSDNLKREKIASGSKITLVASWSENQYYIEYHANVPAGTYISNNVATDSIATHSYTDRFVLRDDIANIYEIQGYEFTGFTDTKNSKYPKVTFDYNDTEKPAGYGEVAGATYHLYAQWVKHHYFIKYATGSDTIHPATGSFAVQGSLNTQKIDVESTVKLFDIAGSTIAGEGMKFKGHTFDHWLDTEKGATYSNAQTVTNVRDASGSTAVLEAQWKEHTYDIKFNYNAPKSPDRSTTNEVIGEKKTIQDVYYGEEKNLGTASVSIKGFRFSHWTDSKGNVYNKDQVVKRLAGETKDNDSVILKYNWINATYSVVFDKNLEGSAHGPNMWVSTRSFTYDMTYAKGNENGLPGTREINRVGFVFKGWTLQPTPLTQTQAVYVKATDVFRYCEPIEGGNHVLRLYAHWNSANYNLTISANKIDNQNGNIAGAAGNTSKVKVCYDDKFGPIVGSELPGYKFVSYNEKQDGTGITIGSDSNTIDLINKQATEPGATQLNIYAQYEPILYNIAFMADSATTEGTMATMSNIPYALRTTLSEIIESSTSTTFKKKGYTFTNWEYINMPAMKNRNRMNKTTFVNKEVVRNMAEVASYSAILKPVWKAHKYMVQYDANAPKGDAKTTRSVTGRMDPSQFTYDVDGLIIPNGFTVPGYIAESLNTKKDGTGIRYEFNHYYKNLTGEKYGEEGDNQIITLYVQWRPNIYRLQFDVNDNDGSDSGFSASLKKDGTIVTDPQYVDMSYDRFFSNIRATLSQYTAERQGYEFGGWSLTKHRYDDYDAKHEKRTLIKDTDVYEYYDGTHTKLYAIWINKEYTLEYDWNTYDFAPGDIPSPIIATKSIYFDMPYGKHSNIGSSSDLWDPSFDMYRFGFWVDDSWDPSSGVPDSSLIITNDTKCNLLPSLTRRIKAYWRGIANSVHLDGQGGTIYTTTIASSSYDTIGLNNVTFDVAGGYIPDANKKVNYKGKTHDQIEKKGYTFTGWFTKATDPNPYQDADGHQKEVKHDTEYWHPTMPATLYATWSPNIYTITYENGIYPGATITPRYNEYVYDKTYQKTDLASASLLGYEFTGWNTSRTGTGTNYYVASWSLASFSQAANLTLYAQWTKKPMTVVWHANKGTLISTPTMIGSHTGNGSTIDYNTSDVATVSNYLYADSVGELPTTIEREGYYFVGWYKELGKEMQASDWSEQTSATNFSTNGWKTKVNSSTKVMDYYNSVIHYYALWKPKQYNIILDTNYGSSSKRPDPLPYQSRVVLYGDKLNTQRTSGALIPGVPNKAYTGVTASLPTPSMAGYTFKGWNTEADGTGEYLDSNTLWTRDTNITLYAIWEAKNYTINYRVLDANDADGFGTTKVETYIASESKAFDTEFTDLQIITRPGYIFRGWWTKNGYNDGNIESGDWGKEVTASSRLTNNTIKTFDVTSNSLNLYARWQRNEFTMKFHPNNGAGSTDVTITYNNTNYTNADFDTLRGYFNLKTSQVRNNTTRALPTAKRAGYKFKGFATRSDATTGINNFNDYIIADVVADGGVWDLYCIWEAKTFKIIFDTNYKDSIKPQNKTVTELPTLPRSADGGEYDNLTLTGQAVTGATVVFDQEISLPQASYGAQITSKNTHIAGDRVGFDFGGWASDKDATTALSTTFTLDKDVLDQATTKTDTDDTSNITLYAVWTQHTYNIVFVKNLPTDLTTELAGPTNIAFNDLINLSHVTYNFEDTSYSYKFVGWSEDPHCEATNVTYPTTIENIAFDPQVTRLKAENGGTVKLYAVWDMMAFPIIYTDEYGNVLDSVLNKRLPTYYNIQGQTEGNKPISKAVKYGFNFDHWVYEDPMTHEITSTSEPIRIEAGWNKTFRPEAHFTPAEFTCIFDANGGATSDGLTQKLGNMSGDKQFIIPDFGYVKNNAYIVSWNTKRDGTGFKYYDGQGITIAMLLDNGGFEDPDRAILFAQWTQKASGRPSYGGGGGGGGGGATGAAGLQQTGMPSNSIGGSGAVYSGVSATSDPAGATSGVWQFNQADGSYSFIVTDATGAAGSNATNAAGGGGGLANSGWYKLQNNAGTYGWYYFNNNGVMAEGYTYDPLTNGYYYLNPNKDAYQGMMSVGWLNVGGVDKYFGANGALQTNTISPDGYTVTADGSRGGKPMTISPKGYAVAGGFTYNAALNQSKLYLREESESMEEIVPNQWVNIENNGLRQSFHINQDSMMDVGLFTDTDGYTYYLDNSNTTNRGAMMIGVININGMNYYFAESNGTVPVGALVKNGTLSNGKHTNELGIIID